MIKTFDYNTSVPILRVPTYRPVTQEYFGCAVVCGKKKCAFKTAGARPMKLGEVNQCDTRS